MKCKIITVYSSSMLPFTSLGEKATEACDEWLASNADTISEVISIKTRLVNDCYMSITIQYLPVVISTTNSPIGSHHWFHTLLAPVLHIGEFLEAHDSPSADILKPWGKTISDNCKELRDGFKSINNG